MPFLSLHDLSFRLPDGRTLFSDLDLSFGRERTGIVGRNGAGKSSLLAIMAGTAQPSAGTIRRDGRVALMRQMADVAAGETVAGLFGAADALALIERIEAGEADADEIARADWTLAARLDKALADVRLAGVPPCRPLRELSGGQRTRAALAALSFAAPDLILMDEPSNNLDAEGRAMLHAFLDGWKGGAAVVSHDRALLNRMDRVVELSGTGARIYGGGFDAYRERKTAERAAADKALEAAERGVRQAARAARQIHERQARRDSAGRKGRAGSSDPKILLDARQERAEATAGRGERLAARIEAQARDALVRSREAVERVTPFDAAMASATVPAGKLLVEARGLAIGHAPAAGGVAPLARVDLVIAGPERVALTGPNGAGKSTLLKTIAGEIPPLGGMLRVTARLAFFDQHVGVLDAGATVLDNYRRLNPGAGAFACRSALARYAFRADAALRTVATLSGGERLRAGLACVAAGENAPDLLILDEPTNHLDLDSIAEVEAALRACSGALLVVSHDEAFLDAIGIERQVALEGLA